MSEKDLRAMIEKASRVCETIFAKSGAIYPKYHAVAGNGEELVFVPPAADKDVSVVMVRALFELRDVVRYVFMDEAWTLDKLIQPEEMDWIMRHGVRNHPKRIEILMIQGEDHECGQIMADRLIVRPANGRARLGPLRWLFDRPEMKDGKAIRSEGRMVGLLPVRGTRQ